VKGLWSDSPWRATRIGCFQTNHERLKFYYRLNFCFSEVVAMDKQEGEWNIIPDGDNAQAGAHLLVDAGRVRAQTACPVSHAYDNQQDHRQ